MLRDGRLRHTQLGDESVHAQRVSRLQAGQTLDQAQTGPVAERPVDANEMIEFWHVHKSMHIYLFPTLLSSLIW
ncbi:MAG: hypothetical protein A2W34_04555 [Chloroflexi bacterium RBG_16_64_32]|nr:MAG: hypothetical protein A2W34_04555 [Chloroflexi bacterium RBG_16_64_32]